MAKTIRYCPRARHVGAAGRCCLTHPTFYTTAVGGFSEQGRTFSEKDRAGLQGGLLSKDLIEALHPGGKFSGVVFMMVQLVWLFWDLPVPVAGSLSLEKKNV